MGSLASLKTSRTLWNCDRIGKSQSDLPKTNMNQRQFISYKGLMSLLEQREQILVIDLNIVRNLFFMIVPRNRPITFKSSPEN